MLLETDLLLIYNHFMFSKIVFMFYITWIRD